MNQLNKNKLYIQRMKSKSLKKVIAIFCLLTFSLTNLGFASNPEIGAGITFDKNPVKFGIGASRTSETPVYPAVTPATFPHRLTATITPKDMAAEITFDSSNVARATVAEVSRKEVGNTVEVILKVTGVTETPAGSPNGDTDIRAKKDGEICATTKVVVIKPTSRTHAMGALTLVNSSKPNAGGTELKTYVRQIVTITIKDQFGNVLDPIYNGKNVVEEKFENIKNGGFVPNWTAISKPDSEFINGIKLDEIAVGVTYNLNELTPAQIVQWSNELLFVGGKNTTFALRNINLTLEADMLLRVDGHAITPNILRIYVLAPTNSIPIPLAAADLVIP